MDKYERAPEEVRKETQSIKEEIDYEILESSTNIMRGDIRRIEQMLSDWGPGGNPEDFKDVRTLTIAVMHIGDTVYNISQLLQDERNRRLDGR